MPLLLHSYHYKHYQPQVYTMISSRIHHLNTLYYAQKYPLFSQLADRSEPIDFSDNSCFCYVKPNLQIKVNCIIVQLNCQPRTGLFEGIDFRVKILLNCVDTYSKVGVYNDRRIFHPNVNLITCELTFKAIIQKFQSINILTNQLNEFENLIKLIMDIIVKPDCTFVADNPYNRKAAWHYIYNRENYSNLIHQYCPFNLNMAIIGQYTHNRFDYLKSYNLSRINQTNQGYWSINSTIKKSKNLLSSALELCEEWLDEGQEFSQKRIKCFLDQETVSEIVSSVNFQSL